MFFDMSSVDDVLDNPDEISEYAKKQTFYSCEENPTIQGSQISYNGKRTLHLSFINEELHKKLTNHIINKAFNFKELVRKDCVVKIDCESVILFHYITENDIPNETWKHYDTTLFSGVIYLNKQFNDKFNNHGTKITKNGENNFAYKYNKMVIYRGDYLHSANFGFGQNVDNSRLTLNFFINNLSIKFENDNKTKEKHHYFSY